MGEDIVQILIAIAFAVLPALAASKKKKKVPRGGNIPAPADMPEIDMDDTVAEEQERNPLDIWLEQVSKRGVGKETGTADSTSFVTEATPEQENFHEEGIASVMQAGNPIVDSEISDVESAEVTKKIKIDGKKMVVYSEIMRPKFTE